MRLFDATSSADVPFSFVMNVYACPSVMPSCFGDVTVCGDDFRMVMAFAPQSTRFQRHDGVPSSGYSCMRTPFDAVPPIMFIANLLLTCLISVVPSDCFSTLHLVTQSYCLTLVVGENPFAPTYMSEATFLNDTDPSLSTYATNFVAFVLSLYSCICTSLSALLFVTFAL